MTSYRTRWMRPKEPAEDPERIAIREALAFGKAVYGVRNALGLSVADLAGRAAMTADEIECIEEGGIEPTVEWRAWTVALLEHVQERMRGVADVDEELLALRDGHRG